jgi:hypothetical protein
MAAEKARASSTEKAAGLIKNKWVASIVSLLVGLGLGTTLGNQVLDSAGIPASCVRAIQRADTAIATGQSVADDGKAALAAVKDLKIGRAADLLGDARDSAAKLLDQAKKFNTSRKNCDEDRK